MRSHSIFQEQKLIALAPLAFYNYAAKTEQMAEEIKPAEILSYEKSPRKDLQIFPSGKSAHSSQTAANAVAKAKSHLVKQEPSNKFAAKPQITYATQKGAKKLLPNFFGSSPSIIPLEPSVASNLSLRKKAPQSFFHFMQPSHLSFNESKNSLNDQMIQTEKSALRAKISHGMQLLSAAQKQASREKICIRRKAANEALQMPFFTELVELQKREITKPTVQVVLAFTSFEKKDLDWAFNLFQSYLTNITNRLVTYNCFEKSLSLYSNEVNQNYVKKAPKLPFFSSKAKDLNLGKNRVKQGTQLLYGAALNVRKAESKLQQEKRLTERITAVTGITRTVRALNEPLRTTAIPLSTQLYTVIRSPHVFKKTREQFATTQYKRVIKLSFRSNVAFRLFIDSFLLLKLPVEVKLVIKDF